MATSIGVLFLENSSNAWATLDSFFFFLYDVDSPNTLLLISPISENDF